MYRILYAAVVVLYAAVAVQAQGIAARSTAETLRGLQGVHVVVEQVSAEVADAGLTADAIKSAVEARLTNAGIPVLGLGALTMDPRGPALLIQLDFVVSKPVYFYSSQVQFFQNVTVDMGMGGVASYASASTWQTMKVDKAGKFRLPTLPQEVVKQVDQFIAAYMSVNAPAPPEGEMEADSTETDSTMTMEE